MWIFEAPLFEDCICSSLANSSARGRLISCHRPIASSSVFLTLQLGQHNLLIRELDLTSYVLVLVAECTSIFIKARAAIDLSACLKTLIQLK